MKNTSYKVLVLGSGGREHALVWKLTQSEFLHSLYCIPGNGGISKHAKIESSIKLNEFEKIYEFIKENKIDIVIVGPEQPSVEGIKDYLSQYKIPVFSPTKIQAQLEGSKIFAKKFMKKYNIPTADFVVAENYEQAKSLLKEMFSKYKDGIVIKADGLAAGKGAVVCNTLEEAENTIYEMMVKKIFDKAGEKVVIEKKLNGIEISVIAFCDGETILPLTHSQDHKQIYDGDKGPNTGGMGAYSPVPFVSKMLEEKIYSQIINNFLCGIKDSQIGYCGVIYFGLMIENLNTQPQPYVLEFNCRFGDPETQVLLPLLKNDLLQLVIHTINKNLHNFSELSFENKYACCVVLASKGYPLEYETSKEITGLDEAEKISDVLIFHAGTKKIDNKFFTSGGRVLNVVGIGKTLQEAIDTSYRVVDKIYFENKYFRTDIGKKGLIYDNV
ncbi:MAG: phosphoribosylamine--glycine ligase [Elusimicrobiales bacterium]|nr:phosphoribosylamine--glycine ligase [Elusimicrobiales bacterium]